MWSSSKLLACPLWARREYPWIYGLADSQGCFEVTNLRYIWGKVAAIREDLTIESLQQVLQEFEKHGLLFIWKDAGKSFAHWVGSDKPGRLPSAIRRKRNEPTSTPPIPLESLALYKSNRNGIHSESNGIQVESNSENGENSTKVGHSVASSDMSTQVSDSVVESIGNPNGCHGLGFGLGLGMGREGDKKSTTAKPKKRDKRIDIKQDLLAWMAKHAPRSWSKRQGPTEPMKVKLQELETEIGAEDFRGAWLEYVDGGSWNGEKYPYGPFLGSMRGQSGGMVGPYYKNGVEHLPPRIFPA